MGRVGATGHLDWPQAVQVTSHVGTLVPSPPIMSLTSCSPQEHAGTGLIPILARASHALPTSLQDFESIAKTSHEAPDMPSPTNHPPVALVRKGCHYHAVLNREKEITLLISIPVTHV